MGHIRSKHSIGYGYRSNNLKTTNLGNNRFQLGDTHQYELTETGLLRCLTCDKQCAANRAYGMKKHIFRQHIKEKRVQGPKLLYAGKSNCEAFTPSSLKSKQIQVYHVRETIPYGMYPGFPY
ncbi:unnamed protein product [Allacma fusca]|uniref:Uncharacterized protein n=1 Tax=Allacma fusca TaxID=39272 RepID=A0A8J2KDJ0_9HEXA|nr:unnamed protein product [Allacma fusca]